MRLSNAVVRGGILNERRPDEECVAIVPSHRVLAGEFALILRDNDVIVRPLGHGSGVVIDAEGSRRTVQGVLVAAVRSDTLPKLKIHARLCGVTVTPIGIEV